MDEWYFEDENYQKYNLPSLASIFKDLCFNRIRKDLRMPEENLHFLSTDSMNKFSESFNEIPCMIMQGGQGQAKHWAGNDPLRREGKYKDNPASIEDYKKFGARITEMHPLSILQISRLFSGGDILKIPNKIVTIGPVETWKCDKVSIWHPGYHDDSFGMRLTTLMISKKIVDTSVPISLLAYHPCVQFNFYRGAIGSCEVITDLIR